MPPRLPTPHFKQEQSHTCVPASARMILAHLGHSIDESALAKLLDTKIFGTHANNIQRLTALGFRVSFGPSSLTNIRVALQHNLPVIAFVMTGRLHYWNLNVAHALVIVGVDDANVYLNDPWFDHAPQVCPIDDFLAAWKEYNHLAAFIAK